MRHDDSLATILLVSRLCAEGVRPLKASEFWKMTERIANESEVRSGIGLGGGSAGLVDGSGHGLRTGPGVLLGRSQRQLVQDCGLTEDLASRIAGLVGRATAMAFELEQLEQSGVKVFTVFDEHYPCQWLARLGPKAPPLVHAVGAVELLNLSGVGVVGSRDVSEAGGEVAKEVARRAAQRGLPLVSGGARGVDQLAMDAAFKAGGCVVGILAESLQRKLKRPDVRRAVHDGRTVLCTPYSPDAPFSAGNAMGRNKLIYAQAALTVVVASDADTGGTWSGATEALKRGYGPVAVWRGPGEGPGNEPLQQLGATAVLNLDDVESVLDNPHFEPRQVPEPQGDTATQQSLFSSVG